jgi:plasmid stability protein
MTTFAGVASITIRRLSDETKRALRVRAAQHGRSMEEEARVILQTTLAGESVAPSDLAESIRRRFAKLGGIDLPELPREPMREPVDLGR